MCWDNAAADAFSPRGGLSVAGGISALDQTSAGSSETLTASSVTAL
jgi:hypothetical protein